MSIIHSEIDNLIFDPVAWAIEMVSIRKYARKLWNK